ncbi:MAG: hypothetical protein ACLFO2_01315 [Candidatus Woesearchaeota archaeon]
MHEPDKAPDTRIMTDEKSTVQVVANISFFTGIGLTILGSLLALLTGKASFFLLAIIGIGSSVAVMAWGARAGEQRAHTTATNALVVNAAIFLLVFLLFIFFKEALQAL